MPARKQVTKKKVVSQAEVDEIVKAVSGGLVVDAANDQDEVGTESAWKAKIDREYEQHTDWFNILMSRLTVGMDMLLTHQANLNQSTAQAAFNSTHQNNLTNALSTNAAGTQMDESVVTDAEAIVVSVLSKLGYTVAKE